MTHPLLIRIVHRVLEAHGGPVPAISSAEAMELIALPREHLLDLLAVARLTCSLAGREMVACGIINAKSGRCPENCSFCAQSAHYDTGAPVWPLIGPDEMLARARELAAAGARRFGIVTSGTALSDAELDALCPVVERIRNETPLSVCASIGMMTTARAIRLRDAGLTRYHHNLETAASHFPSICTTHAYADDLNSLAAARDAGLELCCGGIFGLGETPEQRVELSLTLAELDVTAIPVNFLNPIPGTPLAGRPPLEPVEALRIVALLRLMHPGRDVLICGGRNAVMGDRDDWLLAAGANGLMTGDYLTTCGSPFRRDRQLFERLGLAWPGHRD